MKNAYKIRFIVASVVFILVILGFSGLFYPIKVLDFQFAPLIQRVIIDFSIVVLVLTLGIIVLTILFGRFYCSIICPFGFMQELFSLIIKPKNKYIKNYPVKYFIMATSFGVLIGGCAVLLRYIEPYTFFGSVFTFSILGIVATILVFVITFFKNRFFCTNICPVGALLGLFAKFSLNKIIINKEKCLSCTMCEKKCPSGCINSKEKYVDNETCIKCLKCLTVCKNKAISYKKENKIKTEPNLSSKRRKLILSAAVVAVFASAIKVGIVLKEKVVEKLKDVILPSGAISKEKFVNACYNCNLCVQNCPNKILSKANNEFPIIHIDYSKGEKFCKFDCIACSEVCPTGAIKKQTLQEKQNTRIAMAMIVNEKCHKCNACISACPKGAIIKTDAVPILNAQKCIGCGACANSCWHNAIEIFSVKEQKNI